MRLTQTRIAIIAFAVAALLAALAAAWAAVVVENRSAAAVRSRLLADGITWASVATDGLQVRLDGTAPNEAARFRAVNMAGSVVDSARIRDRLDVTPVQAIEAPRFSVEMLRNDDGIQLIGLVPDSDDQPKLAEEVAALAQGMKVTDLMETAAFPAPDHWNDALSFGLVALKLLPRSKISVAADKVSVTAISESESEKRRLESTLAAQRPEGVIVEIAISAPRPVLTPFTLRFLIDENGARFDACSADTDRARDRIIAAATAAGTTGKVPCTVGLGVPSPSWALAAEAGIRAVAELGQGSITFSDADVSLLATPDTKQADFDKVVGELQTALPPVFSLKATLPPKPTPGLEGPAEFTASLAEGGRVELRGRVTDALLRNAVDSYARAQFGASQVYTATRFDPDLPDGWPVRVLAGLESLAQLKTGTLVVRADTVEVAGVTGSLDAKARITQVLSEKLGQGRSFKVAVTYDERLDPLADLPSPEECVGELNRVLATKKITFTPGSAEIDAGANATVNALAEAMERCPGLRMEIAGHTDAQGSTEGNRALSQARAEAVLLALQGRRVDVSGLRAVGYGEGRPLADNGNEDGREANRRIEFTLLDADGSLKPAVAAQTTQSGAAGDEKAPDFGDDTSPSVAPESATKSPKPRPAQP